MKKLSTDEIAILQKVSDELAPLDDWSIAELTHGFDEWIKYYPDATEKTSRPIPLEEVIQGAMSGNGSEILEEIRERDEFDKLFAI